MKKRTVLLSMALAILTIILVVTTVQAACWSSVNKTTIYTTTCNEGTGEKTWYSLLDESHCQWNLGTYGCTDYPDAKLWKYKQLFDGDNCGGQALGERTDTDLGLKSQAADTSVADDCWFAE